MNNYELAQASKILARLFPKSEWTEDLHGLFSRRIARFEIGADRMLVLLEDYRLTTRRRSPCISTLVKLFREEAFRPAVETKWAPPPPTCEPRDWTPDPERPLIAPRFNGKIEMMTLAEYDAKTGNNFAKLRKEPKPSFRTAKP